MARKTQWEAHGVIVTTADIRRWMQSVAARIPKSNWPGYIKNYQVVSKIARAKLAGSFERIIETESDRANVKVRAPRHPGQITRLRLAWPCGANDTLFRPGQVRPQLVAVKK